MDDSSIKQQLSEISLETVKIATIQSELCVVKMENINLVSEVKQLKQENRELKIQVCELEGKVSELEGNVSELKLDNCAMKEQFTKENGILKNINKAILERLFAVEHNQSKLLALQSSSESGWYLENLNL